MYIYIYMYIRVYRETHIHTYTSLHRYIHIYIYIYIHVYVYVSSEELLSRRSGFLDVYRAEVKKVLYHPSLWQKFPLKRGLVRMCPSCYAQITSVCRAKSSPFGAGAQVQCFHLRKCHRGQRPPRPVDLTEFKILNPQTVRRGRNGDFAWSIRKNRLPSEVENSGSRSRIYVFAWSVW